MDISVVESCTAIRRAYLAGMLGDLRLPEDESPDFSDGASFESQLIYFTLPMSLNYRRQSVQLWRAARRTYEDTETRWVFDLSAASATPTEQLREALTRHRLALQPDRHTQNWQTIARTVLAEWGSIEGMLGSLDSDFLRLREVIQKQHKRGFPYLSGPKIFNYWAFVLATRCGYPFKNQHHIDIAVDTHILKASVRLGVVSLAESDSLPRDVIAARWRIALAGAPLLPTDMNVPLWAWSRRGLIEVPGLSKSDLAA